MIRFTTKSALMLLAVVSLFCIPAFGQVIETEDQKLIPIDLESGDQFGKSVALDGDTAVIGAPGDYDDGIIKSGAAYVFTSSGGVWTEQAKLVASDKDVGDRFGQSVALDGDTAVIGADYVDAGGTTNIGAAYVFTRSGGVWTEQAKLIRSDPDNGCCFGRAVALDGDTAVVVSGLVYFGDELGTSSDGAAYVFTRSGGVWTEQAKLVASDVGPPLWYDPFSVTLDGDTVIIGAPRLDEYEGSHSFGEAYVFTRSGGVWTEQPKLLASDKDYEDQFGQSVALDGDTAVIGARGEMDRGGMVYTGAAYVFTRSGGVWTEQAKLVASDKDVGDQFGQSVALDGDTAVIGAYFESDGGTNRNGAAYVFTRSGGVWIEQVKLLASDKDNNDRFGYSVALDGDTAVIGGATPYEQYDKPGAAYVFALTPLASDDGPYVLDEGGDLDEDVNILDNDSNPGGDPLTPVLVDPPAHASFFQVMPDGTFDYTHDGSETTSDSFTYRASDGVNESEIATVSLEITPVNDAPQVQLIGQSTISIERGAAYTDPGATAEDPEDGDISDSIVIGGDTVDTNTEGTYVITYNVTDSDGLAADEVIRTVIVEIDDPPVITLIGPATLTLQVGDTYDEQGATAKDPEDGDISDAIVIGGDAVNLSVAGTYIVTYNVTDSTGNHAEEVIRAIVVETGEPPVITLIGPAAMTLQVGDSYEEQGATAQDPEDGGLTGEITINDPVDTNTPGTYTVTYTVVDSAGNQAQAERVVIVEPPAVDQPPIITLNGAATVTITEGDTYVDAGATATDDEDGNLTNQITVDNPVDPNTPGTYRVTYSVQDSAGNHAQAQRTVIVAAAPPPPPPPPPVDQPPTVTLNGAATVRLTEGDSYSDAGATASDPEDGDLTVQIVVNNPVDTGTPGTYTVTFTVEDSGGNQAQAERTVIVEAAPPPQPPQTDRGGGGGGGAVSLFELLVSTLMLSVIGRNRQRSDSGRERRPARKRHE